MLSFKKFWKTYKVWIDVDKYFKVHFFIVLHGLFTINSHLWFYFWISPRTINVYDKQFKIKLTCTRLYKQHLGDKEYISMFFMFLKIGIQKKVVRNLEHLFNAVCWKNSICLLLIIDYSWYSQEKWYLSPLGAS